MPPKKNINKAAAAPSSSLHSLMTSCVGCQENQPNQSAHMAWGGCLYDDVRSDNGQKIKFKSKMPNSFALRTCDT